MMYNTMPYSKKGNYFLNYKDCRPHLMFLTMGDMQYLFKHNNPSFLRTWHSPIYHHKNSFVIHHLPKVLITRIHYKLLVSVVVKVVHTLQICIIGSICQFD